MAKVKCLGPEGHVFDTAIYGNTCPICNAGISSAAVKNSRDIAAEIGNINEQMTARGESYVLVGPGRWGSSDPSLGIPVKWSHISGAKAVVECGLEDFRVDASEGTHFFQNLTSFGVGYFTIRPYQGDGTFDEARLNALPAEYESHSLRLVKFPTPLFIKMDGRHSRGIVSEIAPNGNQEQK